MRDGSRVSKVLCASLVALFTLCSGARVSTAPPTTYAKIADAYSTLAIAYQTADATILNRFLAPDFVLMDTSGASESVAETVADWNESLQQTPNLRVTLRVVNAHRAENSATFNVILTQDYTQSGHKIVDVQNEDDCWKLREGTWLLVTAHTESETTFIDGKETSAVFAQKPISESARRSIAKELRSQAWPIRTATPDGNLTDLQPLYAAIGGAPLVGMGEATHGTSEFFSLKDRIFRLLVKRKGFTVLAMEMPWISGLAIDHYLTSGQGNLRVALANSFAVWDNQEVLELIQWMRAYNAQRPREKIRLVGIDMQGNTALMTHLILNSLATLDASEVGPIEKKLECLKGYSRGAWSGQGGKALVEECENATADVVNLFEKLSPAVRSESYLDAEHTAVVAHELTQMYRYQYSLDQDDTRDHLMATNVQWFADTFFPNAKIAIWAHNGHVMAANASSGLITMGQYLRTAPGSKYYVIGFAFDYGTVSPNGISKPIHLSTPPSTAAEAVLSQVNLPMYGLNLRSISTDSTLGAFFSNPQPMRSIEAQTSDSQAFNVLNLKASFDTLIFVDQSHAAHSFEVRLVSAPSHEARRR
jgi:erythromycin esterase